ncbi:hypothetical protein K438DRAFT_1971679 [Mycena galopus ATCC 62051]|nr:hypothetical protein K438DRAFT_1971679 [Mycena galopus ATCC 62051]
MTALLTFGILVLPLHSIAQQSWRSPNINVLRADRVTTAETAIEKAVTFLDNTTGLFPDPGDSYGFSGAFYSQLAEFDLATNQTKKFYRRIRQSNLNDGLNYGHGAAMALAAYNNSVFLTYATQTFRWHGPVTASRWLEAKDPAATGIDVLATGGFFVLSALLAEATGEQVYMDAAKASVDFLSNHLLNPQKVVQDAISARANDSCAGDTEKIQEAYNSGLMIEGLAILYSVTSNASVFDMIGEISSIEAYLSVQFNAVVDLATTPGSNIYAGSWIGPPSSAFSAGNQTSAIQALISVINLQNETTTTTPSNATTSGQGEPSPTLSTSPRKTSNIGPVVGGSLGVLVLLIGVVAGVVLLRRRRRRVPPAIDPFNVQPGKPLAVPLLWSRKVERFNQGRILDPEIESTGHGNGIEPNASQLPTDELVALLYQRMHNVESGTEDRPPGYPETEIED